MAMKDKCDIEHFLDNKDFCEWAKGNKSELDSFFSNYERNNPQHSKTFQDAVKVIKTLSEENISVPFSHKTEVWKIIKQKAKQKRPTFSIARKIIRIAAILLFIISVGSTIYLITDESEFNKQMNSFPKEASTETTLYLDEKKEIEITSSNSEVAYQKNGNEVVINASEKYTQEPKEKKEELVYNQLTVPYGKKSKVLLADGTKVWLNAGSRLIYPTKFGEKNRVVFLEGEGFFDVSKDEAKPFFIHTSLMKVKVVGTSFIVKAYPGDNTEEAIVATGVVSVSYENKLITATEKLYPNQRAVAQKEKTDFEISDIKIKDYTAWLEDMFIFNDEPMGLVLKKIARYYGLSIEWESPVEIKKLHGKLDLKQDYKKVIETLAITSNCIFYENNDTIYFKSK